MTALLPEIAAKRFQRRERVDDIIEYLYLESTAAEANKENIPI